MPITVYLKNMAGEIISIEAQEGWSEVELLSRLSAMNLGKYPSGRTQILRSPGPLEKDEIMPIWVEAGPYVERWEENEKSHVRYIVPLEDSVLHIRRILVYYTWVRFYVVRVYSMDSDTDKMEDVVPYASLYEAIHTVWPEVTPTDMRGIYSIILPDLEKEATRKGRIYYYQYSQEEPVECECGLIVQRSLLYSHKKKLEHTEKRL